MAGQQFLTPRRVVPSRQIKRFTLSQANSTLPLVRRIVDDLVKTYEQISRLQSRQIDAPAKDQDDLQKQLDRAKDKLQGYADELHDVGCEMKDLRIGLVDFVGCHQGRDVCLCWKLGEDTIAYWHEQQAGFAGRQPISTLQED